MRQSSIQVSKGVTLSILFSLVFVLLFTGVIQLFSLSASVIAPVNQVFKVLAIALSGFCSIREERGLFKGIILGALSVIFTDLLFMVISCSFHFSFLFFLELLFGMIAGGISGILSVNFQKRG